MVSLRQNTMAYWPERLPTLAAMAEHTKRIASSARNLVEVRLLGYSSGGRPIELISIGDGPDSALVVGAPHPNEPLGCLVIERFLDQLVADATFRKGLGYRWHFIKAIDVDGVALNEGWFDSRRSLKDYFHGFYRPAFSRQPEYTFPLKMPGYSFDESTLENQCWQRALRISRPRLQCSLHGADVGGAFYIASDDVAGLATALTPQPSAHGLTLNTVGEPLAELAEFAPGLFGFPDIQQMIHKAIAEGLTAESAWTAGDSSAAFAAKKYGTVSLTCEVPLWDDDRLRDHRASSHTMDDVIRRLLADNNAVQVMLSHALPILDAQANSFAQREFITALNEALKTASKQQTALEPLVENKNALGKFLSISEYAEIGTGLRLISLRPYAMVAHLCRLLLDYRRNNKINSILHDSMNTIESNLREIYSKNEIRSLPLSIPAGLQYNSILTTATILRNTNL